MKWRRKKNSSVTFIISLIWFTSCCCFTLVFTCVEQKLQYLILLVLNYKLFKNEFRHQGFVKQTKKLNIMVKMQPNVSITKCHLELMESTHRCKRCARKKLFFTAQAYYVKNSSPLIREIVQLRRMLVGELGSSKTKGPAFGSVSASAAVMLTPLMFLFILSQIWDSLGTSAGGLSLISIR